MALSCKNLVSGALLLVSPVISLGGGLLLTSCDDAEVGVAAEDIATERDDPAADRSVAARHEVLAAGVPEAEARVAGADETPAPADDPSDEDDDADATLPPSANSVPLVPRNVLTFHVDQAVALGSGCSKEDVTFSAVPRGIAVSFNGRSFDMPAGDARLAALQSCSIRVPVDVRQGYRIGRVTQRLGFTVTKSPGASGTGSSLLMVPGVDRQPLTETVPFGQALQNQLIQETRSDPVPVGSSWCKPGQSTSLLLAITVAFSGTKNGPGERLTMVPQNLLLREQLEIRTERCPGGP